MKSELKRGQIPVLDKDYSHVEKAIEILKAYGFDFDYANTGGESSSHDWTCGFDKKYATMKDFHKNAVDDFFAERKMNNKDGGPSLVWEYTVFALTNKEKHTQLRIYVNESMFEENDEPRYSNYYFWGCEDMDNYDFDLAEELKPLLDGIK